MVALSYSDSLSYVLENWGGASRRIMNDLTKPLCAKHFQGHPNYYMVKIAQNKIYNL